MDGLIEALTILRMYGNAEYPTHCEHDILLVYPAEDLTEETISKEDMARLDELGFFWSDEYDTIASFHYGSC